MPQEDVFAFGILGSAGRLQKEPSTCKSSVKIFATLSGASYSGVGYTGSHYLGASQLGVLTGRALQGTLTPVTVVPNGFTMSGILSSLSIDATNNQFVTYDLSFDGVGSPYFAPAGQGNNATAVGAISTTITPVTSDYVEVSGACVNSAKFTLEIPTERLSCLGGVMTGFQPQLTGDHMFVAKPPFKTTMTVEGTSASAVSEVIFGNLKVTINNGKTTSKSFNQSVGDVGANYNYVVESLDCTFADVANTPGQVG